MKIEGGVLFTLKCHRKSGYFFAFLALTITMSLGLTGCASQVELEDGDYVATKAASILDSFLPEIVISKNSFSLHLHPGETMTGSCRENGDKKLLYVTLQDKSKLEFEISEKKLTLKDTDSVSEKVGRVLKPNMVFEEEEPLN